MAKKIMIPKLRQSAQNYNNDRAHRSAENKDSSGSDRI
jgi:hypothetical protein